MTDWTRRHKYRTETYMLHAIASMAAARWGTGEINHNFETAGELAVNVLGEFGLVAPTATGGTWTQAGLDLLAQPPWQLPDY